MDSKYSETELGTTQPDDCPHIRTQAYKYVQSLLLVSELSGSLEYSFNAAALSVGYVRYNLHPIHTLRSACRCVLGTAHGLAYSSLERQLPHLYVTGLL